MKLTLNDGDELEGIAANDRSLVDGAGLFLTPPDIRSNAQRLYIPRTSIRHIEVAALISAGRRSEKRAVGELVRQADLFE